MSERRIIKTSQVTPLPVEADVVNVKTTSTTDTYSCSYINNLSTYSTTEQVVGTWIDGKPLYRKTINFGNLPDNTSKLVAHNITNVEEIWIDNSASFFKENNHYTNYNYNITDYDWHASVDATNVQIVTTNNRDYATAYVTVMYTKTTDTVNS